MDIRTLCLGLLSLKEQSGYEIKKSLEEGPTSLFQKGSFGSIYPALTKLADEGLVTCRTEAQDGRPAKKTYSITKAGQETFLKALSQPPAEDQYRSDFLFTMMFVHELPRERVRALIDWKLEVYRARLKEIEESLDPDMPPGQRFVAGEGIAVFSAVIDYLEKHRAEVEAAAHDDADGAAAAAARTAAQ